MKRMLTDKNVCPTNFLRLSLSEDTSVFPRHSGLDPESRDNNNLLDSSFRWYDVVRTFSSDVDYVS